LGRTFQDINEESYESCPLKPNEFKKMLYGLAISMPSFWSAESLGP